MIDVVHMPTSKSGHECMLTMIDVCSRWAIARPVSNIQYQEMARLIMEEWAKVGVHLVPTKVAHDGGGEFKARFEDMCHLLNKERHVSIGDQPEGHTYGMIELFNRDIVQLSAKMCPSGAADQAWDWALPAAVEAHNSSIHAPMSEGSVGVAPCEILHGVKPKLQAALEPDHVKGRARG